MKRHIWVAFLLFISNLLLFGSEATIDRVVTYKNDSKTSVVIHFSGPERLKFFALDTADGVFTLDFPGVYSSFDFSTLNFFQVSEVRQLPLDPNGNAGISVRFHLEDNVSYHLFEQGKGRLTLYFEMDEFADQPVADLPAPASAPVADSAGTPAERLSTSGEPGENRFHKLDMDVAPEGGRFFLTVDNLTNYKSFFLENPKRFVLDLDQVVLSLEDDEFDLQQPLVKAVRIRQFQFHPKPITRMVLDLNATANVSVSPHENGLMVAYAADYESLNGMLESGSQEQLPETVVAESQPVIPVEQIERVVDPEPVIMAEEEVVATEEPAADTTLPAVLDIPAPQAVAKTLPLGVTDLVNAQNDNAVAQAQSDLAVHSAPVFEDVVQVEETPMEASVVTIQDEEEAPATEAVIAEESVVEAVAISAPEPIQQTEPEIAMEAQADGMAEATPAPMTPAVEATAADVIPGADLIADVAVETPVPTPVEDLSEPLVTETVVEDQVAVQKVPLDERIARAASQPEPLVEEPFQGSELLDMEASDAPQFRIAGDSTFSINDEEVSDSLYHMLKNVKSFRKRSGPMVVTNAAIAANKDLGEMRPIQDDGDDSEFSSLFADDVEDTVGYETIDGGGSDYQGFEISIIDVKDANVVDLLRFIADQVGINLYVDSSVTDLTATYRFRNIPWDQALDIILTNAGLDKEYRNGVLRVATTEKFRLEEEARAELFKQRALSVPTTTVTFPLGYAKVDEVVPIISQYLSPRGTILPDPRTNTLIIADIPQKMNAIRALIKRLDTRIPQVSIEARIVETQKRFLKELGIQWGLSAQYSPELGTDTGVDFPRRLGVGGPNIGGASPGGLSGGYAVNFPVVAENASGIGLTLGNFLDNFKLDISLQMLESEGYGNVISSPKVVAQNNNLANIKNGQTIPIQTVTQGTVTVRFIEAVLELSVRPQITSDDTVIMEITIVKSEPDFSRTVNGIPVINLQEATTKVLVKNGGTAVIGGIFTINEQGTDQGIPGLRNVPFVRRLFGGERFSYDNRELLIFITPRIVKY